MYAIDDSDYVPNTYLWLYEYIQVPTSRSVYLFLLTPNGFIISLKTNTYRLPFIGRFT